MELLAHAKVYFKFSESEKKQLIISAILFGFIFSFRMWGSTFFDFYLGLVNWIFASFTVLIAMLINFSVQKLVSLNDGYVVHFKWWLPGILIGLLLTFMTYGLVPFLYPGSLYYEHIERLRLGRFRYGTNVKDMATLSIWGVVSNVVFAMFVGFIYFWTHNPWVLMFIKINLIYAFYSMLPIPTISGVKISEGATAGLNIFFFSRKLYIFIFFSIVCYSLLAWFLIAVVNSFWLLLLAAVLGAIVAYLFMHVIEDSL